MCCTLHSTSSAVSAVYCLLELHTHYDLFLASHLLTLVFCPPAIPVASCLQAPTAGTLKCSIQQGSSSTSSLCNGEVQYVDGRQAHITIWRQSAVAVQAGGLGQQGLQDAAVEMDDGSLPAGAAAWDAASVFGRRRKQQHRKLVRFA